jgi:hypothetical protein
MEKISVGKSINLGGSRGYFFVPENFSGKCWAIPILIAKLWKRHSQLQVIIHFLK